MKTLTLALATLITLSLLFTPVALADHWVDFDGQVVEMSLVAERLSSGQLGPIYYYARLSDNSVVRCGPGTVDFQMNPVNCDEIQVGSVLDGGGPVGSGGADHPPVSTYAIQAIALRIQ